mgnify:CR=1 FL=1
MRTKILRCIISFIFFTGIIFSHAQAMTNEMVECNEKLEDILKNEITKEEIEII